LYASNIEAVLLKIGLHSTEMGLTLIDNILRNIPSNSPDDTVTTLPLHGRVSGMANESTIDILYQLGTKQDSGTPARLKALMDWLGDSARVALQKSHGGYSRDSYNGMPHHSMMHVDLPSPAPAHVHCVAAILWHSHELPVTYNIRAVISKELLSSMYEWSTVLTPGSTLKRAVDYVLCAMCYIHPEYFLSILEWMGIMFGVDMSASITDDYKDSSSQQYNSSTEGLTDDSKEASNLGTFGLQELGHMMLDEVHLSTLATAHLLCLWR